MSFLSRRGEKTGFELCVHPFRVRSTSASSQKPKAKNSTSTNSAALEASKGVHNHSWDDSVMNFPKPHPSFFQWHRFHEVQESRGVCFSSTGVCFGSTTLAPTCSQNSSTEATVVPSFAKMVDLTSPHLRYFRFAQVAYPSAVASLHAVANVSLCHLEGAKESDTDISLTSSQLP